MGKPQPTSNSGYLAWDMNGDGVTTISDLLLWIEWGFLVPGDSILWGLMQIDPISRFFEITPRSFGNPFSMIVSGLVWAIILLSIADLFTKLLGFHPKLRLEIWRAKWRLKDRERSREKN